MSQSWRKLFHWYSQPEASMTSRNLKLRCCQVATCNCYSISEYCSAIFKISLTVGTKINGLWHHANIINVKEVTSPMAILWLNAISLNQGKQFRHFHCADDIVYLRVICITNKQGWDIKKKRNINNQIKVSFFWVHNKLVMMEWTQYYITSQ